MRFCSQFLRCTEEQGYELYVLGKNGEPKADVEVSMGFKLQQLVYEDWRVLTTDSEGKIQLGKLKDVVSFKAQVCQQADIATEQLEWVLQKCSKINYPNAIKLVVGDSYRLPYQNGNDNDLLMYQVYRGNTSQNLKTIPIKIETGTIILENLELGSYVLHFKNANIQVQIDVLEGKYWKSTNLIVTKDCLLETNSERNQLIITEIKKEVKEQEVEVTVQVFSSNPGQTRVHVLATQFIPQGSIEQFITRLKGQAIQKNETRIAILASNNSYYSNKSLSDEQKYVFDRQNQERYIGNTLEKPSILLKRQFIRDTTIDQEELKQGGDFMDVQQNMVAEQSQNYQQQQYSQGPGQAKRSAQIPGGSVSNLVNNFLNFLQRPALVLSNIHLDENSVATFKVPKDTFSQLFLVVLNDAQVIGDFVPLPAAKFATRDLTQRSTLKKDKYYSIFRSEQRLKATEKATVPDLTSTDLQLVDSVPKLFMLLKELRKCQGNDTEQEKGFDYWDFLSKWERLPINEKHKKFDTFVCDELNIFLFFRDRAYFETYVNAYITNKQDQSFVDHFLLQNKEKMLKYARPEQLDQLNYLEQSLLVIYFAEISDQKELATDIAQRIENMNKLLTVDIKEYKRLFDTVLDAKTAEGQTTTKQMVLGQTFQQDAFSGGFGQMNQPICQPMYQQVQQAYQPEMMMMNAMPQQAMMRCVQASAPRPQMKMMAQMACPPPQQRQMYGMMSQAHNENLLDMDMELEQDYYIDKRSQFKSEFKNIEKTKEYAEKHYAKVKYSTENCNLVPLNGFWVDLVKHSITSGVLAEPFLSSKFIFCNQNHTQMIAVLALMGVPFETPNHIYAPYQGKGVSIEAAQSTLVFTKEIKEGSADIKVDILAAQRFFDPSNRYDYSEEDPSIRIEKDIVEYVVNKIYGCQVIVTNCSITRQDFQVLVEIPEGSIPVNTPEYTKSHTITLDPYTTRTFEYYFYFPLPGEFTVYPANVGRSGTIVAVAKETQFKVLLEKLSSNPDQIDDLLQKGTHEDILKFIQTKNILNPNVFNFHDIYYLLKDKDFYLKLIEVLRKKKVFDYTVWSYSLLHADHESLKEFLNSQQNLHIFNQFKYFKSSLVEISTVRLLEYYPFVSPRVHQLSQNKIQNVQFKNQYQEFIQFLIEKGELTTLDKLSFIYYLLLQERINEAIKVFQSIKEQTGLQYDYFAAYLDFYIGFPNFQKAREICEKYLDYPVIHWRNLFYEIANQLAEYDGEETQLQEKQDQQKQKNKENVDKEETLSLELEGHKLSVLSTNIAKVTLQFYQIDLEVLYSRNPFLSQGIEDFSFILPNLTSQFELVKEANLLPISQKNEIEIPEKFCKSNLYILVSGKDKKVSTRYFSTSLKVQVIENFGQVKVQNSEGKYLSRVYVKTFAREQGGKVVFYKDGYTDLRGRFDYASLNPESLRNVEKFSIFVMSDELGKQLILMKLKGSLIKEVNPPARVGRYEQEVQLIASSWNKRAETKQVEHAQLYEQNQMKYQKRK